jgi:polyisoprenyl-teichoic acid--peptidoglycan teichoic acid transferase
MTLVVPGWAQLSAGNRRIGRLAMLTALIVVGSLLLLIGLGVVWPRSAVWLLAQPPVLPLTQWLLVALAIGWIGLLADAWRLGRPLSLRRAQRLKLFGFTAFVSVVTGAVLLVSAGYVGGAHRLINGVFGDGSGEGKKDGRYNILLLGGDAGRNRTGLRPDSITVASVDAHTAQVVLFGLPRNLQNVPFPAGSVMDKHWPDGFDCGEDCLLNSVYTWAETHQRLFPRGDRPGVAATRGAIEAITGLDISYTVMIDLRGFEQLVDAAGGVTVDVGKKVPLGGADGGPVFDWIEAGQQRMDGRTALWFARSRRGSSDYERMARQKCVLSAMLKQLDPRTVLTSFQDLSTASARTVWTDVPATELSELVGLALRAKAKPPHTVNFVPPTINPSDPDFGLIREGVGNAIGQPRGEAASSVAASGGSPSPGSVGDRGRDEPSSTQSEEPAKPICVPS